MKMMASFIQGIRSGNGLLLFLIALVTIWLFGYYLIIAYTSDEWIRYLRQLYFSRLTLILALTILLVASIPHFKSFISATHKTATDLAIFRILFFGFFAIGLILNPSVISDQVEPFLNLPNSSQVSLPFMSWYPKVVPINEALLRIALILLYISILTSLLGLKTRWSIVIFTISLLYLFAIPNLFGKVNQNHHLIWFPAILAFSPCSDRFSLDAYFQKRKSRAIRSSSRSYTLPFLLIWLLIGLIYFFPGFWKLWSNGLDWCLTENVRNQMYYKWFALSLNDSNTWIPFFRIDQYPILYKAAGIFTVVFELSFIPLIFNKKTRMLGGLIGIVFHVGTFVFMNIFFIVLVWSYLSFVNWNKISFLRERSIDQIHFSSTFGYTLTKWIGITLIISSIVFGLGKWNSWPFTVYPTFDGLVEEETKHLIYTTKTTLGEEIELSNSPLHLEFSSARYWNIEHNIIQASQENKLDTMLMNHLVSIYSSKSETISEVSIYVENQSIIPERRGEAPRELIYRRDCK